MCGNINSLFFVSDTTGGYNFLVDTGAEVSVLPKSQFNTIKVMSGPCLRAANGTKIGTWGRKTICIQLGWKTFQWSFIVAAVDRPIIGSDFLRESGFLVDVKGMRLVDSETLTTAVPLIIENNLTSLSLESFAEAKDSYGHVLSQLPVIATPTFAATQIEHGVKRTIKTEDPLPKAKARRLAPKEDLHVSSAEMIYGCPLSVPGDLISSEVEKSSASEHLTKTSSMLPKRGHPPL